VCGKGSPCLAQNGRAIRASRTVHTTLGTSRGQPCERTSCDRGSLNEHHTVSVLKCNRTKSLLHTSRLYWHTGFCCPILLSGQIRYQICANNTIILAVDRVLRSARFQPILEILRDGVCSERQIAGEYRLSASDCRVIRSSFVETI
jgi:hypothetical protein